MSASELAPEVLDMIERNLAGRPLDEQVDALTSLTPGRRKETLRRLDVVDRYRHQSERSRWPGRLAAEELGYDERRFRRLLASVDEHGPVIGLAPYIQKTPRPRVEDAGLPMKVEEALRRLLRREPEVRFERAREVAESAFERAGLKPVSGETIRRRLNALRGGARPRHLRLGVRTVVEIRETWPVPESGGDGPVFLAVVADAELYVVFGHGIAALPSRAAELAVADATNGIAALAADRRPFASDAAHLDVRAVFRSYSSYEVDEIRGHSGEWEQDLLRAAVIWRSDAAEMDPPVEFDVRRTQSRLVIDRMLERVRKGVKTSTRAGPDPEGVAAVIADWNDRILSADWRRSRRTVDRGEAVLRVLRGVILGEIGSPGPAERSRYDD